MKEKLIEWTQFTGDPLIDYMILVAISAVVIVAYGVFVCKGECQ